MNERPHVSAATQPSFDHHEQPSSPAESSSPNEPISPAGPSSPTRPRGRAWTWFAVVTTVILSIGVVAALQGPGSTAPLDPESATPMGAMALANLLENRGVSVEKVHTLAEAATANETHTLLIVNTSLISESAGLELVETSAKRTVVVGTDGGAATLVGSQEDAGPTEPTQLTEPVELTADCRLPEAQAAGSATFSDKLISGTPQRCFPGTTGAGLLFEGSIFTLADGSAFMNENLAEAGNAALGLNLLSATDRVIWYIPSPADLDLAEGNAATPTDLLPSWIAPVLIQMLLVFGVLVVWQARRLGPLVREPLPIVVPAHETDEGYAGLLQRNKQAGVAATALREASMVRLASMCGLPVRPSPNLLASTLAARLGQSKSSIADVLWERQITTDARLVQLRNELERLEKEAAQDVNR